MRRILFEVPGVGFQVAGFSVALAIACVGALWLTAWRAKRERIDPEKVYDLGVWVITGGFIGARALFILTHPDTIRSFLDIFRVWQGGIVFYGCIIGGLIGSTIHWWRKPFPFLAMADAVAPSLAFGAAVGRVGCYLNGCCWGAISTLPWAVRFPRESFPWFRQVENGLLTPDSASSLPVHPTQLYSAFDGLLILTLLTAYFPRRKRDGEVMALLTVTYPLTRFLNEALRSDEPANMLGMTMSQAISVAIFLAGVAFWIALLRRPVGLYRDGVKEPTDFSTIPVPNSKGSSHRHSIARLLIPAITCIGLQGAATEATAQQADEEPVTIRAPKDWIVELFARDPMLANPVAFCLDEQGRIYVAEEYRFNRGTEENRTRPFLLDDDLQSKSVDDRLAMYKKYAERFDGGMSWFSKYSDQVRLLVDKDGDGKADHSSVFAEGFNAPLDGLAAGVIARDGDVYFTCIPNLWRLRDTDGDGKADIREVIQTGFGVNAGFLGHDLHGLVWGPDGKLYFSIGDRGFHFTNKERKTFHGPRTGAVFRCNPDGSEMQVVARGLRNPQELAFDHYGNLFAVDNNCDKGDASRLVYVVEGGDSGWNMAFQSMPSPYLTGPWHAEKMWHLAHEGQPAWLVPPIAHIGAGPSGFAAYPGVGLPARYDDHLFYCNFTTNGGVEAFEVKPKGAGFEMVDYHQVVTGVMATDVDFGYDGKMYLSDYGKLAWDGSNKAGRIYSVCEPKSRGVGRVRESETLFKEGFDKRSDDALIELLNHPDSRVRLRSQFALADRGKRIIAPLAKLARESSNIVARLHAVWCLAQLGRQNPEAYASLVTLVGDPDARLRGQTAKVLGDARLAKFSVALLPLLRDSDAQVRFHATMAIGKSRAPDVRKDVVAMLRENNERDPFLRHAGVMALILSGEGSPTKNPWFEHARDPSTAVRMAVVVACRKTIDPRIETFLEDPDPRVVTEAARAINDVPIESATNGLANFLTQTERLKRLSNEPLVRRVLSANLRMGGSDKAKALLEYALNPEHSEVLREEALWALEAWDKAPNRDRVNGFWRPYPKHDLSQLRVVVEQKSNELLALPKGSLQARGIMLISNTGAAVDDKAILARVVDTTRDTDVRIEALRLLAKRHDHLLGEAMNVALSSTVPRLRAEARAHLADVDPESAVELIHRLLDDPNTPPLERQRGLTTLASVKSPKADLVLADLVDRMSDGKVAPEIQLDLMEAAAIRRTPPVRRALGRLETKHGGDGPLARFQACLEGGDPERGRSLYTDNAQAQCVRCHKLNGNGGTTGPELGGVATRSRRPLLLQSLIDPDAEIANGFGTVQLALNDGRILSGLIRSEENGIVKLELSDGKTRLIPSGDIDERSHPRSAMPNMGTALSRRDIRDLVAFLATLK